MYFVRSSASNKIKSQTRRHGNLRSHIRFRPRSSTIWHNCLPNGEQMEKQQMEKHKLFFKKKLVYEHEKIASQANNSVGKKMH